MEGTPKQYFNKFTIPVTWGVVTGIISILLFTVYSMFLMESLGFWGSTIIGIASFVVVMLLLTYMGFQQRKAMGGYITFKEAFQAVFIGILIMTIMSQLYSIIYTNLIDPEYYDRVREMSTNFAITLGGDEAGDLAAEQADKQLEQQKSISGQFLSLAGTIILYSLFGFIIAAVVKRKKPDYILAQEQNNQ